jgi:superfamily I DNA/RNA helicase
VIRRYINNSTDKSKEYIMAFVPSPYQQAIFDAVTNPSLGSIIVDAKAGSGKTTTIIEAAKLMKGDIFLGAFNKKMADELFLRCKGMFNVKAGTFHSAGYQAIRKVMPNIGSPTNKVFGIVKALNDNSHKDDDFDKQAFQIARIVSMAKQRGIGAIIPDKLDVWENMILTFGLDENLPERFDDRSEMNYLIKFCQEVLNYDFNHSEIIDFDDMIYLPLKMNLEMPQYDWVMIDEAQDTNPSRRELAKRMLKPTGRMLAVGDPYQAIYGFTGADNDALDQIRDDFNAITLPLSVTYRCPKKVVALAQNYVTGIEAHESAPEGELDSVLYHSLADTVQPGEVILSRYNKYLVNLCFKFIRQGKGAKIEGREVGANLISLAKKWRTKDFDQLSMHIREWTKKEIERAKKKGVERTDFITDRAETLNVLIDRAKELKLKDKDALIEMIEGLFVDDLNGHKNKVLLCSVHRAKGLEWDTVYLLGRDEIMGKQCSMQWQTDQERNLVYVGVTRAKKRYVDVTQVPKKV